ncbi:hypothetical protein P7B02_17695 [Caulobacter segnis]|uniref:hypothetical protein n=1 Tax=Caulobacter segnis TaxID=88688 RepID=UPI00240F85D6|nr:hypothetical protein [Caulobacter segnis]MDG2523367.1 hypothetical protein [Caulobacter segnis]
MERRRFLAAGGLLILGGGRLAGPAQAEELIGADQAVTLARAAYPEPVTGKFAFTVQSTGRFGQNLFLNSREKWQDPDNLAVVIWPEAAETLALRTGLRLDSLADAFEGRSIQVVGAAKRVWIANPRTKDLGPARKPYFATNIYVENADRLGVV